MLSLIHIYNLFTARERNRSRTALCVGHRDVNINILVCFRGCRERVINRPGFDVEVCERNVNVRAVVVFVFEIERKRVLITA